jgi:hypothetical protein
MEREFISSKLIRKADGTLDYDRILLEGMSEHNKEVIKRNKGDGILSTKKLIEYHNNLNELRRLRGN